jgi:hypothetical protein
LHFLKEGKIRVQAQVSVERTYLSVAFKANPSSPLTCLLGRVLKATWDQKPEERRNIPDY